MTNNVTKDKNLPDLNKDDRSDMGASERKTPDSTPLESHKEHQGPGKLPDEIPGGHTFNYDSPIRNS